MVEGDESFGGEVGRGEDEDSDDVWSVLEDMVG